VSGVARAPVSCAPSPVAEAPPARLLVLGLGNDVLTDDAVGLRVAAVLATRFADTKGITVLQSTEMGLALLDLVVGFSDLVLVDAVQTGQQPPGFVHEFESEGLKPLPAVSPHFLGVAETLALGRKLGLAVPARARIFAIEVKDPFTVNTSMSMEMERALPTIVEHIAKRILEQYAS
jgi:hydrogenase maturation protease